MKDLAYPQAYLVYMVGQKSKLLILSEYRYVNKTEKIGGM